MPPYDDWNKAEEDEDDELQDSMFEGKRDVILFAIDCSESMHVQYDDPDYEDVKTCHLFKALEAAMQISKRKVVVGPNDSVGIMLFNTARKSSGGGQGAEIKGHNFLFQPITTINASQVQELIRLLDAAREDADLLRQTFPPHVGQSVPVGDVFTSCNWIMRDGAPKTASKRVFLITDEDDPNAGPGKDRLMTAARTTLIDLTQAGVNVEPFFISTDEKPFDQDKFYSSVLLPESLGEDEGDPFVLPESISITRIADLLAQMKFHEVPKRALFSIPFEMAPDFVMGVKGYGLVTEQTKGLYRYFADLGDRMEPADSRTAYVDQVKEAEAEKNQIVYGMGLGETVGVEEAGEADEHSYTGVMRVVPANCKVFYTTEEKNAFRTMGLEPGIKLLGFKDRSELAFEDNIKHSYFIYPDELRYSGSKRTFSALLKSMVKKEKIGLALVLMRRNSCPAFCALLPQEERTEEGGWNEPPGIHLIILPFADDIRAAVMKNPLRASDELKDLAAQWIEKLKIRNGYPPDSYPNPALAFHNAQLEATAFREDFDAETFEDLTLPKHDMMHKRAGPLIKDWVVALREDENANVQSVPSNPKKRKATDSTSDDTDIRELHKRGQLAKLTVDRMKTFCRDHGLPTAGKKADLTERIAGFLASR